MAGLSTKTATMLQPVRAWLGRLIASASSAQAQGRARLWLGRFVTLAAIAAALGLGGYTIYRLDQRPRTHDAFLYADTAGLAPDVSGRIVKLHVRNNQRVSMGYPLVEIDPEPFELRLRQARAQVAALQAEIALTTRQVGAQSSGADAAATHVGRARSQLALARDTLQRLTPLLGKGYVTTQHIDEASTNERTAQATLTAAIQQARQARQAVGDTESLQAQLKGAEAAVALADRDLRNATVRAPFDGLVVGLEIAEGAYAVAGHSLFTLIKAHEWYAVGNFRETELPQIAIGDPATVWLLSDNNHPIGGHVESLGWGVRPVDAGGPALPAVGRTLSWVVVAQRFPVRIRLDAPPETAMRIGATVSILVRHGAAR
jgi:multidrug efflux system membrane fusion protein